MEENTEPPRLEALRQLREEEVVFGESTFNRSWNAIRPTLPQEVMVRFEGVPG